MASKKWGLPNSDLSLSVLRPGTESQGHKIPFAWKDWSRARLENKMKRKKFSVWCVWAKVSECVVVRPSSSLQARNKTGPDETDLDLPPWFCVGVRWLTRRLCVCVPCRGPLELWKNKEESWKASDESLKCSGLIEISEWSNNPTPLRKLAHPVVRAFTYKTHQTHQTANLIQLFQYTFTRSHFNKLYNIIQ